MINILLEKALSLYAWVSSEKVHEKFEHVLVSLAIVSFLTHLTMILVSNAFPDWIFIRSLFGTNYLTAINTPLNIILFYEIVYLVLALSKSIIIALQKQFEVVSLIVIREAFKELSNIDIVQAGSLDQQSTTNIAILIGGGILCFLLVSVIRFILVKTSTDLEKAVPTQLVVYKKIVSLTLLFILLGLVALDIVTHIWSLLDSSVSNFVYYHIFFFLLIFVDVLAFLVSMYFSDDYGVIFLDSAFVISTIIIRFSLILEPIYKVSFILFAIFTVSAVLAVYRYLWLSGKPGELEAH